MTNAKKLLNVMFFFTQSTSFSELVQAARMSKLKTRSNTDHDPTQPGQNRWPGDPVPSLRQTNRQTTLLRYV